MEFQQILLLFVAFCATQFLFNVLWKTIEGLMSKKQTDKLIDSIIAKIARGVAGAPVNKVKELKTNGRTDNNTEN